ncbi:MAG: adenylate kinase [Anaerolineae bacterium]|nr:adenylate kinase [Anaerolineae bacterium]
MSAPPIPRRIAVIGTSGSGKTTFARRAAERLGIHHVELDAIFWGPGWTQTPVDEFRARTAAALAGDAWTTDGNYSKVRDIVWGRADTVVWLDYPLPLVLWRVTTRTLRRCLTREELWSGNRENVREAFFSRDSIILYSLQTYRRRKRQYQDLFCQPEYAHLHVVRLCSPRATRRWLAQLPAPL